MIRNFENGDIATSGVQFRTGAREVGQAVRARLRMFFGEWFLDISQGTPWFQSILGKAPQDVAEIALKQRILTAPGVVQIRRFEFTPELGERRISVTATVATSDGEDATVELNEVLQ